MFIAHKSQNNNNSGPTTIYPLDYYENTYWYSRDIFGIWILSGQPRHSIWQTQTPTT
jgi:hypothetical protein